MKIAVALAVAGLALIVGFAFRPRAEAPEAIIRAELAGLPFAYARRYARDEATAAGGALDRLSFRATAPDFGPVTANVAPGRLVTVSVSAMDDGPDPAERAATLYARFLTPAAQEGPEGLVRRQFEPGSPYDFEELYLAPPDGRRFYARCPKSPAGAPDGGCLSMFRDGAVDVELRYPAALLDQWDMLYDGARGLIARMTARRR